jgi:hypothetical protein
MATYSKQVILHLKNIIKQLAQDQKSIKPQRKTIKYTGERIYTPYGATVQHGINRYDLRHLYIAYGFMRGKTFKQIEPSAKTPFNENKVDEILKQYEGKEALCA